MLGFLQCVLFDQEMVGLAGPQSTLCPRAGIPVPASQGLRVRAHLFGQLTNHDMINFIRRLLGLIEALVIPKKS